MAALPSRILIISLRRIGDLLLTTPVIRSIRRAWPGAEIDVLVFDGTAGIIAGNPDIDRILTMPQRPTAAESLRLIGRLWRLTTSRYPRKAEIDRRSSLLRPAGGVLE